MPKSQRLVHLIMRINALKSFTVQQLADEFGLSTRTITRDLQELSELGVPIYSVQGRGGGYKLLQERMLPPISFTENEAVAMFIACQSLQHFGALPFDEGADAALHKFYHYLPADVKEQIDRLKNKVAIWSPHRYTVPEYLQILLQAIMIRSAVTIEYSSGNGRTKRDIQPIGLFARDGYWYCPAYCFLRKETRLFRADRIRSAALNGEVPCREDVGEWTLWNAPSSSSDRLIPFTVSLARRGVRALESDIWFGASINRSENGGGTATILIPEENLTFYADLVWRLGEDATIVGPLEAVEYVKEKIGKMTRMYGG